MKTKLSVKKKITHKCRLEKKITEKKFVFVRVAQLIKFFLSFAVSTLTPLPKKYWN